MNLLLDTCTFLWISQELPQASAAARAAYLDENNPCFLSAASIWELALKHAAGKLSLLAPPEELVARFLGQPRTQLLSVDHEAAHTALAQAPPGPVRQAPGSAGHSPRAYDRNARPADSTVFSPDTLVGALVACKAG